MTVPSPNFTSSPTGGCGCGGSSRPEYKQLAEHLEEKLEGQLEEQLEEQLVSRHGPSRSVSGRTTRVKVCRWD